jgi:glutamine synthetase
MADRLYVNYNVFKDKGKAAGKKLESLPASCWDSAEALLSLRHYFEKDGIFPAGVIDNLAKRLKSYNDQKLSEELYGNNEAIAKLVKQHLHCG